MKTLIFKNFDKCVTLYMDFLSHSNSTPSETIRVLEVSSGRRGGSGDVKVKDRYYTKDEYRKMAGEHKVKLKKIRGKRGSN